MLQRGESVYPPWLRLSSLTPLPDVPCEQPSPKPIGRALPANSVSRGSLASGSSKVTNAAPESHSKEVSGSSVKRKLGAVPPIADSALSKMYVPHPCTLRDRLTSSHGYRSAIFPAPQAAKRRKVEASSGSPSRSSILQLKTQLLHSESQTSEKPSAASGTNPSSASTQRTGTESEKSVHGQVAPSGTKPELPRRRKSGATQTTPLPSIPSTNSPRSGSATPLRVEAHADAQAPPSVQAQHDLGTSRLDVSSSRGPGGASAAPVRHVLAASAPSTTPGARVTSTDASIPSPRTSEEGAPSAVLKGADPDIVRYLEGLGLPAEVYASKLEAVGLKNGTILNAMRELVPENRKDKLEEEMQRLGGVSVAEAMVLVSGFRRSSQ